MKNSSRCTKCESRDLVRIPGWVGPAGIGNNIPAGVTVFSYVKVTRLLCSECGYSEEWVEEKKDLEKIKGYWGNYFSKEIGPGEISVAANLEKMWAIAKDVARRCGTDPETSDASMSITCQVDEALVQIQILPDSIDTAFVIIKTKAHEPFRRRDDIAEFITREIAAQVSN